MRVIAFALLALLTHSCKKDAKESHEPAKTTATLEQAVAQESFPEEPVGYRNIRVSDAAHIGNCNDALASYRGLALSELAAIGLDTTAQEEFTRFEEQLIEQMRANCNRSCKRPLLHGEALPGPADSDQLNLLAVDGPLGACFVKVQEQRDALEATLDAGNFSKLDSEFWLELAGVRTSCSRIEVHIQRAVSHLDACSVFGVGRMGDYGLKAVIGINYAARVRAQDMLGREKNMDAIQLLLDTTRLGQDLMRGESRLVKAMVIVASQRSLLGEMHEALSRLRLEELQVVLPQLLALVDSRIPVRTLLSSDELELFVYSILRSVREPGWNPPGGFGDTERPLTTTEANALAPRATLATAAITSWKIRPSSRAKIDTCDLVHSTKACLEALLPDDTGLEKFLRRYALADADLLSLVLHASSRIAAFTKGDCPAKVNAKFFGEDLKVSKENDEFIIEAPGWVLQKGAGDVASKQAQLGSFSCKDRS